MANYNQAPKILAEGTRFRGETGKAIRSHDLETAIMNGLGDRDIAMMKVMFFLTGQAQDGQSFGVAEKTICERCNISERGYKSARKKLVEKGWIKHEEGKITILYDNIYNYKQGITENTPKIGDNSEHPNNELTKQRVTENTPILKQGVTENTPLGITENTHNNIINSITSNNIIAPALSPDGAKPPLEGQQKEEDSPIGEITLEMLGKIDQRKIQRVSQSLVKIVDIPKAGIYKLAGMEV